MSLTVHPLLITEHRISELRVREAAFPAYNIPWRAFNLVASHSGGNRISLAFTSACIDGPSEDKMQLNFRQYFLKKKVRLMVRKIRYLGLETGYPDWGFSSFFLLHPDKSQYSAVN
jgi:hypothetical protein